MSEFEPTQWEQDTPDAEKDKKSKPRRRIAEAISGLFKNQRQEQSADESDRDHWWQFGSSESKTESKTDSISKRLFDFLKLSSLFEDDEEPKTETEPIFESSAEQETMIEEEDGSIWERIRAWRKTTDNIDEYIPPTEDIIESTPETADPVEHLNERTEDSIEDLQRDAFTHSAPITKSEAMSVPEKPQQHDSGDYYKKAYKKGYYKGAIKHGWKQRRKRKKSEKKLNKQIKSQDKTISSLQHDNEYLVQQNTKTSSKPQSETTAKSSNELPIKKTKSPEITTPNRQIVESIAVVGAVVVVNEIPPPRVVIERRSNPQPIVIIEEKTVIQPNSESKPIFEIETHIKRHEVFIKERIHIEKVAVAETKHAETSREKPTRTIEQKSLNTPEKLISKQPKAVNIDVKTEHVAGTAQSSKTEVNKLNKRIKEIVSHKPSSKNVQNSTARSNWRLSLLILAMLTIIIIIIWIN